MPKGNTLKHVPSICHVSLYFSSEYKQTPTVNNRNIINNTFYLLQGKQIKKTTIKANQGKHRQDQVKMKGMKF